jgi:hypothetical protein
MKKVRKRTTRQKEPRKRRYKLAIERPKLIKTKKEMTVKRQKNMKNRQKPTINKIFSSPMLVSKALSDAGKLLVNAKSSARVKRVAASRLGAEKFLRLLSILKFLKKRKGKRTSIR